MSIPWVRRANFAFSLVELSIVLVILGLLVGGVLSGQSLIHAAELRSFMGEYTKYTAAVHTFRDKYFALPGDLANATAFWGSAGGSGSDGTCSGIYKLDAKTCNGNGDGRINTVGINEEVHAWQHMGNAGLIEGFYPASGPIAKSLGHSRTPSLVWAIAYSDVPTVADAYNFAAPAPENYLGVYNPNTLGPVFIPVDAWNIDTKMDDGRPQSGKWRSEKGFSAYPCSTVHDQAPSAADDTATYNFSTDIVACRLTIYRAF